jgi:ABC-type glycerol-3-phosphate transport system substrate-binding protein
MARLSRSLLVGLALCVGLVGCQSQKTETRTPAASPRPSPTLTLTTESGTRTPATSLTVSPASPILPTGPITLTVWTTQEFAPSDEDAAGRLFLDQLLDFQRDHTDVKVEVVVKRLTGPGGIMDYLDTASAVAPAVLPDITILSSDVIPQASAEGVLQPLDGLLPEGTIEDLFPVGDKLGRIGDALMAIPFTLDFQHLVYNTTILTATTPTTWDEVLYSGGPLLFPAGEEAPVDTVLDHYLAAGGTLAIEDGALTLAVDPLTEVLRFYQRAALDRVVPVAVLQLESLAGCLNAYRGGSALIAHVSSALYLPMRADLLNTAVAPVTGPRRPGSVMISGWHWAILTPDSARQQLAANFVAWLLEPDNVGGWSYSGHWLPASINGFARWPTDDEYISFARDQILLGIPRPAADVLESIQPLLRTAMREVLLGSKSPAAAAASVAP